MTSRVLRLREERLKRGWSQTRVSMLTGIAGSDVSAIECGKRYIPPGWRRRLAAAFRLSEAELFSEIPGEEPRAR